MEYLYERVAYLRGLCEGLGISEETKEGRVLEEIVEILGEFADAIVELSDKQEELEEYTELIDEDLSDLEDDFYDESDETEMVIRLLSFGPMIKVIEPLEFKQLIRQRLKKQKAYSI